MNAETTRKEFEEWFESWSDPNIGLIESRIEKIAAMSAWAKASRLYTKKARLDCADICRSQSNKFLGLHGYYCEEVVDCERAIRATIKEE